MAEENEPPAEKGRRVYKGEQVDITSLRTKTFAVIQFLDREVSGVRLPLFGVVRRVGPSWRPAEDHVVFLDPRNGFRQRTVSLPKEMKVNLLTGRQGEKLKNEFIAWQETNGLTGLGRFSERMGADPEIFVEDKDGNIIPAWTFLGDKLTPNKTPSGASYYGGNDVYWDGFQAEFTVAAGTCLAYVTDSVRAGLLEVWKRAKEKHGDGVKLSLRSVVPVPWEVLETAEEKHVEFGCMPSKNVYGLAGNTTPGREVAIRFAGGHIHFGGGPDDFEPIVRALDAVLGVTCVALFDGLDNPVRREFYGLPGEYRTPEHGLEYRTLSNAWLMHPAVFNFVFELSRRAYELGRARLLSLWKATEEETVNTILRTDVSAAREILKRNEAVWRKLVQYGNFEYGPTVDAAWDMTMRGAREVIAEPENLVKNWKLDGHWLGHSEGKNCHFNRAAVTINDGDKL